MPDRAKDISLSQRTTSYFRVRCQRAFRDARQSLGGNIKFGVVSVIAGALLGIVVQSYTKDLQAMSPIVFSLTTALIAVAVSGLLYFLYYFFAAPSRIYWDGQKKIADLENQLDRQSDIQVKVPRVYAMDPGAFRDLELSQDGLVIFLQDIRFTNRSITHRVSLDLTLMVPGRGGYYEVTEGKEHWRVFHDYFLFTPIDIGSERTRFGNMCFLISPETVRKCGGKWKLNYKQCRLKIFDTVSEKKMDKDISQEALESQQSIRDTPVWHNEE